MSAGTARSRRRRPDPLLAVLVGLGTLLRVWGLGAQSYWYDEWLTARAAGGSAGALRHYVTDQAGIPPTYFVATWLWAHVVGTGEVALRSISAAAGVATIVVTFRASRALGLDRRVGLIAALLVAVNPMLVWFSQEARPYGLVALATACTLLFLGRWWHGGRRIDLAWWALAATLAIALHYYAVFLVAVEAVTLVALRRPRWSDARALVPAGLVALVLAPFGVQQFGRRGNHSWIGEWPLEHRVTDAWRTLLVGPSVPEAWVWVLGAVAFLTAALTVVTLDRAGRRTALGLGALGLGAMVLTWLAAVAGIDAFVSRYLIGSVVPLAVVATLTIVSLVAVVAVQRTPDLQRADWRSVAEAHERPVAALDVGARAIVVDRHTTLALPLRRYLDDHRVLGVGESIEVTSIDVVGATGTDHPCNMLVGLGCALVFLGAPLRPDLADRLHEAERIEAGQLVVVRYVADEPVQITPEDLAPTDATSTPFVLVDDP